MSVWGILAFVCFALFAIALITFEILRCKMGQTKKQTIEEERKANKLKKASRVLFFVALAFLLLGILGIFMDHQAYMANARHYVDERLFG